MTLRYKILKRRCYNDTIYEESESFTVVYNKLLVVDMMLYLRLITNNLEIIIPKDVELIIKEYLQPNIPNLIMERHKKYIHIISTPVYDLQLIKTKRDGYHFTYGKYSLDTNDYIHFDLIENNLLDPLRYDFAFFIKDYDFVMNEMKKYNQFKEYYNSIRSNTNLILSTINNRKLMAIWELWIKYFKKIFLS